MISPATRRWRRVRRWALMTLASAIVLAATLQALARLAVPWVLSSPERVSGWLSATLGQRVDIDQVSAVWVGRGPWLDAKGVRVIPANGGVAVDLGSVRIGIDSYALLFRHRPLIEQFLLVDARVELERDDRGKIVLRGLGAQRATDLSALNEIAQLGISNGAVELRWGERNFALDSVELRLVRSGDGWRGALLRRADDGHLRFAFEFADSVFERIYVEAQRYPLRAMAGVLDPMQIDVVAGNLDGQFWWQGDSSEAHGSGELVARDLVVGAPSFLWHDGSELVANLHVPSARVALQAQRKEQTRHVDISVDADSQISRASLRWTDSGLTVAASDVPAPLAAGATLLGGWLSPELRRAAYESALTGRVGQFNLSFTSAEHWHAHADLIDVGFEGRRGAQQFELRGFDGAIEADPHGVIVRAMEDDISLALPPMLGAPIAPRMDLIAQISSTGLPVELARLRLSGPGYDIHAEGALFRDPEGKLGMDVRASVPEGDIAAAPAFWILNKMPPKTVDWLNRSLSTGKVIDGRVAFRGAFGDWPFARHEGRFEASFNVLNAPLDYHAEWPSADAISADVSFVNNTMLVHRVTGQIQGLDVSSGRGGIADMKQPVLMLDLTAQGDGADWLKFLERSPLQREHGDIMFGMALSGPASIDTQLSIPLKSELGTPAVRGSALADGLDFRDAKWRLDFADLRGRIDFTHRGFAADQLRFELDGEPGELQLAVGEFVADSAASVEVRLGARSSLQSLFGQHETLAPILAATDGKAHFDVEVRVDREGQQSQVRYRSDLDGLAIHFPAPLDKPGAERRRFEMIVPLPLDRSEPLTLSLGDQARLTARVGTDERPFAGVLQLGATATAPMPERGLRVAGTTPALDVPGWAGWVLRSLSGDGGVLSDIDVRIGERGDNRLRLAQEAGSWTLHVDGDENQGVVRFGSDGGQAVVDAEFERIQLPEPDGASRLALSPSLVPTLHLRARSLQVGAAQLGDVRIEAFPKDGALRIEQVQAKSDHLEIRASGDWRQDGLEDRSSFKIQMTSEDLGRMLTGLGYDGVIAGGQTLAQFNASWSGAPHQFALERLRGTMDITVGEGRFLDVDPGAGRIFGLLSLRELPRRITLDFRDFFESGMTFNKIEGRFEFADGNAWTEGISVRGPAADLLIIGRTGLASRDYDQQVMVAPHFTGVLPVIGGLAAGPVGAAAGFLAQGLVAPGANIEDSTQVHYSIGGSWEKPQVERIQPSRNDSKRRSG